MGTRRKYFLLCILIALLSGSTTGKFSPYDDTFFQNVDSLREDIDFRLPTTVKPDSYEILLKPNLRTFHFEGTLKINATVQSDTRTIVLHVGNITVTSRSVVSKNVNFYESFTYDEISEKYTLHLRESFKKGTEIVIAFTYHGILRDDMIGFYRSSYVDADGQLKWLAATQFQATHARHAFPCFDEPSFKAKFRIRIARDIEEESLKCLSNMPLLKSETLDDEVIWDTFEDSMPMSTYLVAFVISEFSSLPSEGNFTVWARPALIDQTEYAFNTSIETLKTLSDMFQQPYDYPKMDMVAVPDFSAGAMENLGLVMYRESRMLYDATESSELTQQTIAAVIAHELTHTWFGNMVTPEWWNCLWLSEAFATYFQYFATAQISPSWSMKKQFVVDQHQSALISDGLESSRPMTRDVSSQSEIGGMGDAITYAKGASIVRMMSSILGTSFHYALRKYLQNNKKKGLGNPEDLWSTLQEVADQTNPNPFKQNVKTVMDTWTRQAGYPVVSVTIDDSGIIRVNQERFLLRNLEETPTNVFWRVPLTWTTQENSDFIDTTTKHWLNDKNDVVNIVLTPKEWVIFNIQSSGFYRVNYNDDGWQRIFNALHSDKFSEIGTINRAAIVDDLLNLGRAGYQDYQMVLDATTYLKKETDYLPFKAALNGLNYLNTRLTGYKEHSFFKKYVLSLIDGKREELGYEDRSDDNRLTVLLRRELNDWACKMDDEKCITTYKNKFQKWKTNPSSTIKPNERSIAYCVGIRHGTPQDWEFLWEQLSVSNNPADQTVIMNALACTQDTALLEKYLQHVIDHKLGFADRKVRKQDSVSVFNAVCRSSLVGAEFVLDFVGKHLSDLEIYYGKKDIIATILDGASQYLSTPNSVDKFENLLRKHRVELMPIIRPLRSSLDIANYELIWLKSAAASLITWLRTYNLKPEDSDNYRLPSNIRPTKYTISITPYLEDNFVFDGNVKIEADVVQPTKHIILHSAEIEYNSVNVEANGKIVEVISKTKEKKYDFYKIELPEEQEIGTKLIIEMNYKGHLNSRDLRGFYKSSYIDGAGKKRWLATTHLEPVGARRMFPCFDEPELKATFNIKVSVPQGYHAISNMNVDTVTKDSNNRNLYTFVESKKMSTYLVAIIVSDFASKIDIRQNEIPFSIYARPNAINQTDDSLSTMRPFVKFFEKKLNQDYQLPKLDMAALPDFPSGAMENWGLLTYKETNLLYNEEHSPITNKQAIRNVIAHEISHQWFGNLVSPQWWKYLWLNEGFGRYFQYHAAAYVYSDTTMEAQFVVDQVHSALRADSSINTHAMSHDVYSPSEISAIFDTISYAKAASILRMIEKTYGQKIFYDALSDYLNKRKYDVATPEDLYKALQTQIDKAEVANIDIAATLDTWTTQPGYPVVHANIYAAALTVSQERFVIKVPEDTIISDFTWHIPITYMTTENIEPSVWLMRKEMMIPIDSKILILNVKQSGYYRVNYDRNHWSFLTKYLNSEQYDKINAINRATLIDDIMNLARANHVDYETVMLLTMYLRRDSNYYPWRAFYNNLPYLYNRFRGRDVEDLFKKYLVSIIEPLYTKLGFNDTVDDTPSTLLTNMLRIYTREWACKLNIGDCRYQAAAYFQQKFHRAQPVMPNYRGVVYCNAIRMDTTGITYDFLWKEYLSSNVVTDKLVILKSLACSQVEDTLKTLLTSAISQNSPIRYQDSAKVFSDVYGASLTGVKVVMDFIKNNYDLMRDHFDGHKQIQSMVSCLATELSTDEMYEQYRGLLDWLVNKESAFKESVDSYLWSAKYELDWYGREAPGIFVTLDRLLPSDAYRLPTALYPELYRVSLTPDVENGMFDGRVQIHMRVAEGVRAITLNSHNLKISLINVYKHYAVNNNSKAEKVPSRGYALNETLQQLRIYLDEFVSAKNIMVEIKFSGTLNDNMQGFYRSSYYDGKGKRHWLATTQFAPTHARQAFPCFDEPAFKSKFIIDIQRPVQYKTLSNMPLLHSTPSGVLNYMWDTFTTTEVMSPYLVAFAVSEFESVGNGLINVWGRPEVAQYGSFAQEVATTVINSLESFTGIPYSLPKLDLIGIPDFFYNAMENWGLITFREYALFYKSDVTNAASENYVISVVAHELSHMWFGNLVTCHWWEYIWLNEGFAEYFQWLASDAARPKYRFMDQFVVYELQPALLQDASETTHPMTNPVETPKEIKDTFDYVAYGKSSSVLRMIFNVFGETIYKLAIRDYLTNQRSGTARPTDLWKHFDAYSSISIGGLKVRLEEVMDTWTNQPGYPVVHAQLNGSILTLTQERFRWKRTNENTEFYWIPIQVVTSSDAFKYLTFKTRVWLGLKPVQIYINPNNEWFVVNYMQTGFYRVNYDADSWQRLIDQLNSPQFESIHVLNRAQIIDDLFNLARAGYVKYDTMLAATRYLSGETDHLPWRAFFNGLSYVYERFEERVNQTYIIEYSKELLSGMFDKVGFTDKTADQHLDELNREMILTWACKLDNLNCTEKSVDLFGAWRNDNSKRIPRNARAAVYCTAIKNGTKDDWEFLWNQYLKTNFASEQKIIMNALGCSRDRTTLYNYLRMAISDTTIRKQDIATVFASIYGASQLGVNVALDFLIENTMKLHNYFGNWDDVGDLFKSVASHISSTSQNSKLQRFAEENPHPEIDQKLVSAIIKSRNNLEWYDTYSKTISFWIQSLNDNQTVEPDGSCTIVPLNIILVTFITLIPYLLNYI